MTTAQRRRAAGRCPDCAGRPSEGRTYCDECNRVRAVKLKTLRHERRARGLCEECDAPTRGERYCLVHAAMVVKNKAAYNKRQQRERRGDRERMYRCRFPACGALVLRSEQKAHRAMHRALGEVDAHGMTVEQRRERSWKAVQGRQRVRAAMQIKILFA